MYPSLARSKGEKCACAAKIAPGADRWSRKARVKECGMQSGDGQVYGL